MNDELRHYGILGMKWGVRRNAKKSEQGKSSKPKKLSEMSDDELRKFNNRKILENQYTNLTKSKKNGWKYVASAVGIMSTAISAYNNVQTLKKIGNDVAPKVSEVADKIVERIGPLLIKNINWDMNI